MGQLDVFKFVNIVYQKDTINNNLIANIYANSSKKYMISDELGFSVSQGLPGPFGSITFTDRNVFNRCEIFEIGIRGGIEGVASASDPGNIYSSQEVGANISLTFPRLLMLMNLNSLFINNNPKTRFTTSYNFIFRPEYSRSNLRLAMTYHLMKGNFRQYTISFIDINYLRTYTITDYFQNYLNTLRDSLGNTLYTSFQNSLNPNINASYTFNDFIPGINSRASFFRLYAESGGTTLNALDEKQTERLKQVLDVNSAFIYYKVNLDMRGYFPMGKRSTFATRLNIGIANPYGANKSMPYEKFFFTGGTNSNRAWLPRRLGPGSYNIGFEDGGNTPNYTFEQPGLFLLEINEEFRFKIIKFLDGAIFVDAGNVWELRSEDQRKNIKIDSYKEIAVGGGVGLRLDFSFLIFRVDVATKLWNPVFPNLEDRFVAKNITWKNPLGSANQTLLNIAIGYPF